MLPAFRTANSKKSNKLPPSELLKKRKETIVSYWEMIKDFELAKFKKEAETLMILTDNNCQNSLFSQISKAIEMTGTS